MKELERETIEAREKLKGMNDEYTLLRKNIARFIRKKDTDKLAEEPNINKLKEEVQTLAKM